MKKVIINIAIDYLTQALANRDDSKLIAWLKKPSTQRKINAVIAMYNKLVKE